MTLSDISNIASVVGLALTLWVALNVRKIKNHYLLTARVPELSRKLSQHRRQLCKYLNDAEANRHQIEEELAAAKATAQSLEAKLTGRHRESIKLLLKAIREQERQLTTETGTRAIYRRIVHVSEELENMIEDLKWDR